MYDTKYFERVPGRCGGRVTFIGRRIEPSIVQRYLSSQFCSRDEGYEFLTIDLELSRDQIDAGLKFDTDDPDNFSPIPEVCTEKKSSLKARVAIVLLLAFLMCCAAFLVTILGEGR